MNVGEYNRFDLVKDHHARNARERPLCIIPDGSN
jgi:hypothetical protein